MIGNAMNARNPIVGNATMRSPSMLSRLPKGFFFFGVFFRSITSAVCTDPPSASLTTVVALTIFPLFA